MLSVKKLAKLANLPVETQVKTLKQAIDFYFKMPAMALDIAPEFPVTGKAPSLDRIKAYFAQKYNTPSDTPVLNDVSNQFEQFFHTNMPEYDLRFTALFDLVDLRGTTHDHFDIIGTNAGITWTQRKPGELTKIIRNFTESKATVNYLEFTTGVGILDTWLQFQQFWSVMEVVSEFRNQYYEKMAETHYGLFTALSTAVDQAFATDDTTTANNAAAAIIRACKSSGYAVGDNPSFKAVCALEKVGRLQKMLTATVGSAIVDFQANKEPVSYRIEEVIGTSNVAAADTGYYLILPGRKIKRGVWKDLTTEDGRNLTASATDIVGTGQYNAAIGDTAQVRRVKYA